MPTPDFSKVWASNSPLPEYTFSDADYLTGWDFVGSAPPTKNEFDAWFKMVDTKLNWLYGQLQDTASKLYPVGSVYISFNSTSPSTLFGGTWTRLKDRFLMASGDSYAPNTTGGSATKTIAVANIPSHNHTVNSAGTHNHTASASQVGNHTHSVSGTTGGAGSHNHNRGNMNITGTFGTGGSSPALYRDDTSGAFYNSGTDGNKYASGNTGNDRTSMVTLDASRNWVGTTNTVANHTHSISATSGGAGSHSHTITVANNGSHTHTTNNTGGGLPLNIMPPYQTVYMWRRTA